MSRNTDYIHQLMTEKQAGIISALDEAFLDELINTDPGVGKTWTLMQSAVSPPKKKSSKMVLGKLEHINRLLVAAVITMILFASYYVLYITHSSSSSLQGFETVSTSSQVQLRLSNGQVVNLSEALDTVRIGNTQLATVNRTLVFPVGALLPNGINTITVPVGQTYNVMLPDGSIVWLNSTTQMKFPTVFDGNNRKVVIRGEAYLEVARNKSESFIVDAGNCFIQVLGTAFNINNYDPNKVKVSLINGAVKIKMDFENKQLKPGEQAIMIRYRPIILQEFDAERELAWKEGIYYFTDASLEEICQVIPRWFHNRVEIDSAAVGKQHFTGRLQKNLPIAQFLEVLKATSYIRYDTTKQGTIHFR